MKIVIFVLGSVSIITLVFYTFIKNLIPYFKKFFNLSDKSINNIKEKTKVDFSETIPNDFISDVLKYIWNKVFEGVKEFNFKKEKVELLNVYFTGATLCLDIKNINYNKIFVITISSNGSVGYFDPEGWCKGYYVEREKLSEKEFDIYKDIYKRVKGKDGNAIV